MIKTKLAKAVSMAMAGSALCTVMPTAFASTTMYNTWDAGQAPGCSADVVPCDPSDPTPATDGWTTTGGLNGGGALNPWYGWNVNTGTLPFGYSKDSTVALSWAIELSGPGDSGTISAQDSLKYGGPAADIDTARGAWLDGESTPQGWRHAIDLGLIKANNDTVVRLTPSAVDPQYANNFGITVLKGMSSNSNWSHHGGWHVGYVVGDTSDANLRKVTGDTTGLTAAFAINQALSAFAGLKVYPDFSGDNIEFVTFMDGHGTPYVEFTAEKDQVYTVILGGSNNAQGLSWGAPVIQYQLDVATVPVPAAVWLFGSAVAGMIGVGRRRAVSAA